MSRRVVVSPPTGLCECGCGGVTGVISVTRTDRGYVRGEHYRYPPSHWSKDRRFHSRREMIHGYVYVGAYDKPRRPNGKLRVVAEHVVIVERALGKPLPVGAHVHHVDEDRANNDPSNLVACQDSAYHKLLHVRAEALRVTGDANKRRCHACHQWDDPVNLEFVGSCVHHHECERLRKRDGARKARALLREGVPV